MSEEDDFEEKRKEELKRLLEEAEGDVTSPEKFKAMDRKEDDVDFTSREYRTFVEEEREHKKLNLYEKACNLAGKIVKIEPSEERKKKMQKAIDFAYMQITPAGAYSFAILSGLGIIALSMALLLTGVAGFTFTLLIATLGMVSMYLLVRFPQSQARLFRVKASNEIMLAVIYLVIYMRSTPNLEGAIRFTANHLKGPLSLDFKKILWDLETRKYSTAKAALIDYLDKWEENQEFIEAMNIIQNSMEQAEEKRKAMLDEAVNTMMSGSRERMKRYSNSLRLPIMVIHSLGIILPIMVLVMFPIIILMLREAINPLFLVIGYDAVLPLVIYLTGKRTLQKRPLGFSTPDISMHPDYTSEGTMSLFGKEVKIWPISLVLSVVVTGVGIYLIGSFQGSGMLAQISSSLVVTWGLAVGPISYFILDTRSKLEIRKNVKSIEEEFSESLFSLGNRLSLGKPMERAMEDTLKKNKDLEISNLYEKALRNIKKGGMNVKNALFDREFGAVWNYPSKMIISVLRVVMQATGRGVEIASLSAISISKYLKQMHQVEEDLKDMLSGETSSMQFLGSFLGPLVAGVTVTMAAIMMRIFQKLGSSLQSLQAAGNVPGGMGINSMMIGGWGEIGQIFPIIWFQLVVGIYVVEISYLLGMLSSGIENGPGDKTARRYSSGWIIFIGMVVYSLSVLMTYEMFGSTIETLLAGGLV